jgi:hypothetical protein
MFKHWIQSSIHSKKSKKSPPLCSSFPLEEQSSVSHRNDFFIDQASMLDFFGSSLALHMYNTMLGHNLSFQASVFLQQCGCYATLRQNFATTALTHTAVLGDS